MLMHVFLGALVSGAVLLTVALLVDDGAPLRPLSLRAIALLIAVFGLAAVSSEALGLIGTTTHTLVVATAVGLTAWTGVAWLGRRERA